LSQWSEAEQVVQLQRQIESLRTRMNNIELEALETIRRRNAKAITMQHNTLRRVFHPDSEANVSDAARSS